MNKKVIIGVVGLGYVGLPLAVAFSKKYKVYGYDCNLKKIECYKKNIDVTNEVGNEQLKKSTINFTADPNCLSECDYIIVAVPTPLKEANLPDLKPLEKSSEIVGKYLKENAIVIYESTVYPGLTEEFCMPILEKYSKKKCGVDFKIAYSPERINPGDKVHNFESIRKIVSGMDSETLNSVSKLYSSVLKNGVFEAESIKVAEAAKVVENTQRDVNIAFMNQLSIIFHQMGIDTKSVLEAASSKWNFLNFEPGLVGGHCIGVDPFYLIYKSEQINYSPELLKISRKINNDIPTFVAESVIKQLIKKDKIIRKCKVAVYGVTFKENVPDIRNSKVIDIVNALLKYGVKVLVYDYVANIEDVKNEYRINICQKDEMVDVKVFAVAHDKYKDLTINDIKKNLKTDGIVFDLKNIYNKNKIESLGIDYWSL